MADIVRILRVVEYVGERAWVERTLARSISGTLTTAKGEIRAAIIGQFPEILTMEGPTGPAAHASDFADLDKE